MVCRWFDVCPLRRWEREGRVSDRWKREYCLSDERFKDCMRYRMEARDEPHPGLLPDGGEIED